MSHLKERKEKICLNCNTGLNGRYCHHCGQENIEPKDTVWSFVSHFFYDITHFDGKFFYTVGKLFRRPGFLTKEYITGKRAGYLHPIRMYIFSSAVFFLIFFSLFDTTVNLGNNYRKPPDADSIRMALQHEMLKLAKSKDDSVSIIDNLKKIKPNTDIAVPFNSKAVAKQKGGLAFSFMTSEYSSRQEYDSLQKTLPGSKRDGWLKRRISYRSIDLSKRYIGNDSQFFKDLMERFLHSVPYMLFVSLPLFALFLKLIYIRRKKFYYVDHGLFLIHLYVFTFLFLLVYFSLSKFHTAVDWGWLGFLEAAMLIYGIYYTYKAMKNFYGQGTGKTILKFLLFNFLSFISIIILFALFFALTIFRV